MGKQSARIATALAASLLGLVTVDASRAAELNSGYVVSNQGALGITRAFDDGQNTVLAFIDLDSQLPQLRSADGQKITFSRVDNYAVLPGRFDEIRVTTAGNNVGVVRSASIQAPAASTPAVRPTMPVASEVAAPPYAAPAAGTDNHLMAQSGPRPAAQTMALSDNAVAAHAANPAASTQARAIDTGTMAASPSAAAPVTAAPRPAAPATVWQGKAPTDAKLMLLAWAAKAHWTAIWDAGFTFPVKSDIAYDGSFEEAVGAHYAAYTDRRRTKTPLCVDLHRSNRTVHVYQPDDSGKCDALRHTAAASETKVSL